VPKLSLRCGFLWAKDRASSIRTSPSDVGRFSLFPCFHVPRQSSCPPWSDPCSSPKFPIPYHPQRASTPPNVLVCPFFSPFQNPWSSLLSILIFSLSLTGFFFHRPLQRSFSEAPRERNLPKSHTSLHITNTVGDPRFSPGPTLDDKRGGRAPGFNCLSPPTLPPSGFPTM